MSTEAAGESFSPERYNVLQELGRGAMGVVYLAFDKMLQEEVALKVLHENLTKDEQSQKRFLREISLTRKVTHANVVRTFDAGSFKDLIYVSMEYVKGSPLKEYLSQTPPSLQEALRIFEEITWGLQAIHRADIIHRDLKLSNILLDLEGSAKIADFGIARPKSSDLTNDDEMLGTATHMAPEVWKSDTITKQTDLYALGVIGYELFTHILPFPSSSPMELMYHHIHTVPVDPRKINEAIPEGVAKLILQLLQKEPKNRPGSAVDVLYQIDEIRSGSTLTDETISTVNAGASTLLEPIGLNPTISQRATSLLAPATLSSWIKVEPNNDPKKPQKKQPLKHFMIKSAKTIGILGTAACLLSFLYLACQSLQDALLTSWGLYGLFVWGSIAIGFISLVIAIPWLITATFRGPEKRNPLMIWFNGAALVSLFGCVRFALNLMQHYEESESNTAALLHACVKALTFTSTFMSFVPIRTEILSLQSFLSFNTSSTRIFGALYFLTALMLWSKIFYGKVHWGRILPLAAIGIVQYVAVSSLWALSIGSVTYPLAGIELKIQYYQIASCILWMALLQFLFKKEKA